MTIQIMNGITKAGGKRASDHRRPHRKSEEHCQNAKDPRFIVIEDGVEGTTRGHIINSLRLIGSWWCFFRALLVESPDEQQCPR